MLINAGPQSPFAHARQTFPYALVLKEKTNVKLLYNEIKKD